MNLTNNTDYLPTLESTSFSKYLFHQDRMDQYNYSQSNINETLLLEATITQSKPDLCKSQPISLLKQLKDDQGNISQEKSLVFDLCGELSEAQSHCGSNKTNGDEHSKERIEDLYLICRNLVDTISKLENKVEKIEGKDHKGKQMDTNCSNTSLQKQIQSRITYSSLQNSKGSRSESQKDIIQGLFDALQSKSETKNIKQEYQEMKKNNIRLEIANQELRKNGKRTQGQNARLRQLLKQYQNFNKRLIIQKSGEDKTKISRNLSQKMLSQRHFCHQKTTSSCFEDYGTPQQRMMPFQYYNFKNDSQELKQNKSVYADINFQADYPSSAIETPSYLNRNTFSHGSNNKRKAGGQTLESKIVFQPQEHRKTMQKVNKTPSGIKILSFGQCRSIQPTSLSSSPFTRKCEPLKPVTINNSKSFRDLKPVKSRNYY